MYLRPKDVDEPARLAVYQTQLMRQEQERLQQEQMRREQQGGFGRGPGQGFRGPLGGGR